MSSLSDHPTVRTFWEKAKATPVKPGSVILDAQWLRELCLDAGADDVGFVDIDRPELGNERAITSRGVFRKSIRSALATA